MPVPPEPSTIKALVETLLKPFTLVLNPIAERIGNTLKRKPKLHIYVRPLTNFWYYAWDDSRNPIMGARFCADITNDSREENVLILDGYVKGTKPKIPFPERIEIPATTTVTGQTIVVFCLPIVGKGGKDFTGRIILIDQFKRKHPTDKVTFTWTGPTERSKFPTAPSSSQDKRGAAGDLAEYGGDASKLHE